MRALPRRLQDEAGIALPFIAVALLAIFGVAALGVETGRLALVATEAQNAADIAATAAAGHYVEPHGSGMSPRAIAEAAIAQNKIAKYTVSPSHLTALELGNYDPATGSFVSNLAPINAARAEIQIDVENVMMNGLAGPTSHVTKEAIAGFSPTNGGRPTLPLTIGQCLLHPDCNEDACQPTLYQVPNPDENTAWTGLFEIANVDDIAPFFPEECVPTNRAPAAEPPWINVGDFINLISGQSVPLLDQVKCLLDNGLTEVIVPVVECDVQLNQAREVMGFATFEIVAVQTTGGNKGIEIRGLASADNGPGGGHTSFGAGTIVLVH